MQSLWDDAAAARCHGELGLRVYTSRLLGRDRSLVLHGGGNTSVKLRQPDIFGEPQDVLYVKGSGWDLETIEEAGFTPLRLEPVRRLATLPSLSDPQMVNELIAQTLRAGAPVPSVEAILHAILPHRFVDHTHADAVVTVTGCPGTSGTPGTPGIVERVREIYGDTVLIVPYVMPGFVLARAVALQLAALGDALAPAGPAIGMVLLQHGIFSFGDTARESYERMIHLVDLAENYLRRQGAWVLDLTERARPAELGARHPGYATAGEAHGAPDAREATGARHPLDAPDARDTRSEAIASLRHALSAAAGRPLVVVSHREPRVLAFVRRPDLAQLALQGPATPDHVLRTKPLPMIGRDARDVAAYEAAYRRYFEANAQRAAEPKTMLDPAPRIVLDPELGMLAAGRGAAEAAVAAEIYLHTMDIVERADRLGGWRALPAADLFDMEYWDLEQAKIRRAGAPPPFAGEVALVTGAASGIGRACVETLLERGAAVVALDLDPRIAGLFARRDVLGVTCDVTAEDQVAAAVAAGIDAFGGLDVVVASAGIFPDGRQIAELPLADWRQVMAINLDANLVVLRLCHPFLRRAPRGGRVAVIGSKNVPAPGPGVAAYSASKAALQQLARVAALEWGRDGIRVNVVHPNAVFDTAIWTPERLASRAAAYGLDVESYRRSNVLGVEVRSRDVAEVAVELCGPRFSRTTGARVPVDGGNERVI